MAKRKSEYNKFVAEHRRAGKSMKQIAAMWNAQKAGKKASASGSGKKASGSGKKASGSKKSGSGKKASGSKKAAQSWGGRFASLGDRLESAGLIVAEVGGATAVASGLAGYVGDENMKMFGKDFLDYRAVVGLAGVAGAGFLPAGWSRMVTNLSAGAFNSWLAERAHGMGSRIKQDAELKAMAAAAPPADAPPMKGLVTLGYVGDGVGDAEKRLERKLAKLKKKADKKGVDWSDVREADKSKKAMKIQADMTDDGDEDDGYRSSRPAPRPAPQPAPVVYRAPVRPVVVAPGAAAPGGGRFRAWLAARRQARLARAGF